MNAVSGGYSLPDGHGLSSLYRENIITGTDQISQAIRRGDRLLRHPHLVTDLDTAMANIATR
jgi:hypothetical protein